MRMQLGMEVELEVELEVAIVVELTVRFREMIKLILVDEIYFSFY